MFRRLFLLTVVRLLAFTVAAEEPLLRKGDRVMFLGDSITQDGRYILALDLLLRCRMPDAIEFP